MDRKSRSLPQQDHGLYKFNYDGDATLSPACPSTDAPPVLRKGGLVLYIYADKVSSQANCLL